MEIYGIPITDRDQERFWLQVEKTEDCWIWTGPSFEEINRDGKTYRRKQPKFSLRRKTVPVRKAAYMLLGNELRDNDKIYLSCKNIKCVNPEHFVFMRRNNLLSDGDKICCQCQQSKNLEEFNPGRSGTGGRQSKCKECSAHEARHRVHGITKEEYTALLIEQDGLCAICGNPERKPNCSLAVDHNHTTNQIRGLLCSSCNLGIGNFLEKRENFFAAVQYLDKYELI